MCDLMASLQVTIRVDSKEVREFHGSGPGPELVSAFRCWLSSPVCGLAIAEGADDIDAASCQLPFIGRISTEISEGRQVSTVTLESSQEFTS